MVATTSAGNEVERLLSEGQEAARQGDNEAARTLLTQVVERDPQHEQAWMWLSGVVVGPDEQQICLENVLVINPGNAKARRGLDYLMTKTGHEPAPIPDHDESVALTERTAPLGGHQVQHMEHSDRDALSLAEGDGAGGDASGPGLPTWLQAALAGHPAADAAPAQSPDLSASNEMWNSGHDAAPDGEQTPPWADVTWESQSADASPQATPYGLANASHLSNFDLSGELQPFTPFGEQPSADDVGPMGSPGSPNMGPMGPMGPGMELPEPSQLPHYKDETNAQPWYLQGSSSAAAAQQEATGYLPASEAGGSKKEVAQVGCPSCKEQVPETSLSCPNCRYNFFINCPHCHELVDAGDAKPSAVVPCPHCSASIDRFDLGATGTEKGAAHISERVKSESDAEKAMQKIVAKDKKKRQRNITFGWAVDLMWLVVIVATIWALSQLPTWLKLTGQY